MVLWYICGQEGETPSPSANRGPVRSIEGQNMPKLPYILCRIQEMAPFCKRSAPSYADMLLGKGFGDICPMLCSKNG